MNQLGPRNRLRLILPIQVEAVEKTGCVKLDAALFNGFQRHRHQLRESHRIVHPPEHVAPPHEKPRGHLHRLIDACGLVEVVHHFFRGSTILRGLRVLLIHCRVKLDCNLICQQVNAGAGT